MSGPVNRSFQAGKGPVWGIALGLAVVVLVVMGLLMRSGALRKVAEAVGADVAEVVQGPLTVSVTESGSVQPRDQVIIKSEVEGVATILYLIDEGVLVKKGDLLVELDSSQLQDLQVNQEIALQNAEAAYIRSRETLEVMRNKAESDVEQAELTARFAEEDRKKYIDGDYPNLAKDLEAKIILAEEELQRAEEQLKWSRILFQEKYVAESELKADELAANKAKLNLELAQSNYDLLIDYKHKRSLDETDSKAKQSAMSLERIRRSAAADLVLYESDLRAKEAEFRRQKDKLDKLLDQIQKTKIYAPTDGRVIYSTSASGDPHHRQEPLDEGQQIREQQELIYLPTASTFKAQVKIHESSLDKIRVGLPVRVTVDAVPGQTYTGSVASVAPLPDPQSMWMNPDLKVFATEIQIEGGADVLRTGMTCKAEIIIQNFPSAVTVPMQCVVRVKGKPTVFVKGKDGVEERLVEIGMDNQRRVIIQSGLTVGERVLLSPPLAAGVSEGVEPTMPVIEEKKPELSPDQPGAETPAPEGQKLGPGPGQDGERRGPRKEGRRPPGDAP